MKIEKMTTAQMKVLHEEIITKLNKAVQESKERKVIKYSLLNLIEGLDELDGDDFWGTEGWREYFNIET